LLPGLDVTDVLDDPDFQDTSLRVFCTALDPRADGTVTAVGGWQDFTGVVSPDGGRDLVQLGEGDALDGAITIYTRFPLSTGGLERAADRIQWGNGGPGTYTVVNAQPWQFGDGYVKALCKLADNNPSETEPPDGYLG